jgi:hypothetical protein
MIATTFVEAWDEFRSQQKAIAALKAEVSGVSASEAPLDAEEAHAAACRLEIAQHQLITAEPMKAIAWLTPLSLPPVVGVSRGECRSVVWSSWGRPDSRAAETANYVPPCLARA